MKSIRRSLIYMLTIVSFITACNKKELAVPSPSVVKMTFEGYAFNDTLEVMKGNEKLATLRANSGFSEIALIAINNDKEQIGVRKKGTTEILSTFEVPGRPSSNRKRYFSMATLF